jgi:DeoR/GlpR family transcriptional regulator of sugar metabolism
MPGSRASEASIRQRRDHILGLVLDRQQVPIPVLAATFGVSSMTMRRDLVALQSQGLLLRRSGQAVAPPELHVQTSASFRRRAAVSVKEAVARAAVPLFAGARTLMVDDSTSVLPLLSLLAAQAPEPLTVVTNYLDVVRLADAEDQVEVHLLGGDYVPVLDATFGSACVEAVGRWHVDVFAFSMPAVDDGRCSHPLPSSVAVKEAMMSAADRRILLLDHTKLGRTAPHVLCAISDVDAVVVDSDITGHHLGMLRATGASVLVAPRGGMPHAGRADRRLVTLDSHASSALRSSGS